MVKLIGNKASRRIVAWLVKSAVQAESSRDEFIATPTDSVALI